MMDTQATIQTMRDKLSQNYGADITAEVNALVALAIEREEAIAELLTIVSGNPGFLIQAQLVRVLMLTASHTAIQALAGLISAPLEVGDSQVRRQVLETREIIIKTLGEVIQEDFCWDLKDNPGWGLEDHHWNLEDGFPRLVRRLEDASVDTCIETLCNLLSDPDLYETAARAIEAIKCWGDSHLRPAIAAKLEQLHQQGVPVYINAAEVIEEPILVEIRQLVYNHGFRDRNDELFPRMRLGIVKSERIDLSNLTKEFGLRYREKLYQAIAQETAKKTMHDILCHDWDRRYEHSKECPREQLWNVVLQFFQCFEAIDGSSITYYTNGHYDDESFESLYSLHDRLWKSATLKQHDEGILIIAESRAGCFWLED
jgi:hypothetical protein